MRKCQPHLRYATTVFLNTRAIPIGSQYRAAHDKAMTGNGDNDTSVQPQPFIIEGTRNGGSPVRTTGRLDSYGVGKLPAA